LRLEYLLPRDILCCSRSQCRLWKTRHMVKAAFHYSRQLQTWSKT